MVHHLLSCGALTKVLGEWQWSVAGCFEVVDSNVCVASEMPMAKDESERRSDFGIWYMS